MCYQRRGHSRARPLFGVHHRSPVVLASLRDVHPAAKLGVRGGMAQRVVRVLIVDDQPSFRQAERIVVDFADGFEVVGEVDSGEAALDALDRLEPGLILMDVHLPGISGPEAADRARQHWTAGPWLAL
jgi:PleD family two-component response regulator